MNNANAIALIETGAMSTEKMLELCEKATDNYNDDPRRTAVVRAFVRNWKAVNPLASNQNLMDLVATCSKSVQAHTVYTIASEMGREDFVYGFQKLSCVGDLIFVAGPSGKYTQDEIFEFSGRVNKSNLIDFWGQIVNANVLDAEGLYRVAMLGHNSWPEMQKLCLSIISKNRLTAEQLMNVCEKYSSYKEEAVAAVATGQLSDDQIIFLCSKRNWQGRLEWDDILQYLKLEDRTVSDLITFGEKVDSDKLWPSITKVIDSKKTVHA
jgi:hypothetical protein